MIKLKKLTPKKMNSTKKHGLPPHGSFILGYHKDFSTYCTDSNNHTNGYLFWRHDETTLVDFPFSHWIILEEK
jgi:hypothetical protein